MGVDPHEIVVVGVARVFVDGGVDGASLGASGVVTSDHSGISICPAVCHFG